MAALSRRGAAAAGAAILLAAAAPAVPASPDAALLDLCERLASIEAEMRALEAPFYARGEDVSVSVHNYQRDVLVPQIRQLRLDIGNTEATTRAGLIGKARAVLADYQTAEEVDHDHYLAWSIARDLLEVG